MSEAILSIDGLHVAYGQSEVLHGLSLSVAKTRASRLGAATAWARRRF